MNIITKIEVQKKNKERVNIFIDEEFAFAISAELVYKYNLKPKMTVDIEVLKEVAKKESIMKCRSAAIRIIERTFKTEKELKDKLLQKGYEVDEIESAVEFLKEYNYINDDLYVKSYIKDKIKMQGQNKILYDLKRKGVSEELIKQTLASVDDNDVIETAYLLAEKKYNVLSKKESDNYKLSQKLYRYLVSRGYSFEIAKQAINRVTNNDY